MSRKFQIFGRPEILNLKNPSLIDRKNQRPFYFSKSITANSSAGTMRWSNALHHDFDDHDYQLEKKNTVVRLFTYPYQQQEVATKSEWVSLDLGLENKRFFM